MGGQQDARALRGQLTDQVPELCRRTWIEATCGFVEQHHGWLFNKSACDAQPLVHATGELHHQRVGGIVEAGAGQEFVDSLRPRPPRYIVESCEEVQVLACGEAREERPLRGNGEPDSRPHGARIRCGIEAFYHDPAAIGQQHGGDEFERGRLAAAVWAEQDQNASRGNFKRDVIESNRLARALTAEPIEKRRAMAKDFADGFEYDRRHVEQRRPDLPVERRALPPAWTGETPVPPQPGLRKSLYYSGREKAGD